MYGPDAGTAEIISVIIVVSLTVTVSTGVVLTVQDERSHDPRFSWDDTLVYVPTNDTYFHRVTIDTVYGADQTRPLTLYYGIANITEIGSLAEGSWINLPCPSEKTPLTIASPTRAEPARTIHPCPESENTQVWDPEDPGDDGFTSPTSDPPGEGCVPMNPTQKVKVGGLPSVQVCPPSSP